MCFVWISEQTAMISVYSIKLSVFKTKAESVYFAVRNGSLNQADTFSYLKGWSKYKSETWQGKMRKCIAKTEHENDFGDLWLYGNVLVLEVTWRIETSVVLLWEILRNPRLVYMSERTTWNMEMLWLTSWYRVILDVSKITELLKILKVVMTPENPSSYARKCRLINYPPFCQMSHRL